MRSIFSSDKELKKWVCASVCSSLPNKLLVMIWDCLKKIHDSSRRFKTVQEGSRRFHKVPKFQKVSDGLRSFKKDHECSKRFKEVQEGSRRFRKVINVPKGL